jgi:hypothetical protein
VFLLCAFYSDSDVLLHSWYPEHIPREQIILSVSYLFHSSSFPFFLDFFFSPPVLLHLSAFLLPSVRYFCLLFHSFAFPSSVSSFF